MFRLFFAIFILILFICCQPASQTEKEKRSSKSFYPDFYITQSTFLLKKPGPEGQPITKIEKGDSLLFQNELSDFLTLISKDQKEMIQPWYLVSSVDDKKGWVFGGFIRPIDQARDWEHERYQNQLSAMLGDSMAKEIINYQDRWKEISKATELQALLEKGKGIPLAILNHLEEKGSIPYLNYFLSDSLLPGVRFQDVSTSSFQSFLSYKAFLEKAMQTPKSIDEEFFRFCCSLYAQDSIEYYYKNWDFPVNDQEIHSYLGSGNHYSAIVKMDSILLKDSLFKSEILAFKQAWLNSIINEKTTFWEKQPAILSEMDSILALDLSIFSAAEKKALKIRNQQLQNASDYGILLNLRSGNIQ